MSDSPTTSSLVVEHLLHGLREYAIIALEANGVIADWSAGGFALTGYSADEIVGRPLSALFGDDGPATVAPVLERAADSGSGDLAAWVVRRDGTRFWSEGNLSAIRREPGLVGYAVVLRDGTEQKRMQEKLRVSEATYQGILAIGSDAVVCASDEQRITFFNNGAEAMFGYAADEVLGRPLEILVPEYVGARHQQHVRDFATSGVSARRMGERGEISGVRKDGTTFPAEASISKLEVEGTRVFTAVLRDITERKRIQEKLRISEATYQGILAISADAVVCVSDEQRITFFNNGAEAMFGYAAAEVLGKPLDILVPEYVRAHHQQHVRDFAASGVNARRMGERGEISGVRKDGTTFPAEAAISKLDVEGTRVFTAVLRDVTERRDIEDELAARARELARSNEELEQFAYVASHDLQEPLRMVASYTQLIARRYGGKLDKDADEFIGFAVDGATRMRELIEDLLAYSRVGTRGGEWSDVSLDEVLERVRQTIGPAAEEAGAVLTSEPLPTVRGDPIQLLQLLQNLVANAVKFRGKESPKVHVSAARGEGEWIVSVRDNGIGIAAEFRDRIFVIFQRLHGRGEYPGTGIGLAICRKIVERHGGEIWVESEPGQGSTFHFTLPDENESP